MRKPAFCICENKDTDQLRGNREADQRLCFRYTDSMALCILWSGVMEWSLGVEPWSRVWSGLWSGMESDFEFLSPL